jgi:hypothetical protein
MKERRNYQRIEPCDLQYLWINDYYDGPLTGMTLFNGEKHWFKIKRASNRRGNLYFLYKLTPDQITHEEYWHKMFEKYVGTHWTYINGKRQAGGVHSSGQWNEYYEAAETGHKELELKKEAIVGYYLD